MLVSLDGEVLGDRPKLGATVAVRKTEKLSNLGAAMMLNQAAGNVLPAVEQSIAPRELFHTRGGRLGWKNALRTAGALDDNPTGESHAGKCNAEQVGPSYQRRAG
jgi:hypothetical protein